MPQQTLQWILSNHPKGETTTTGPNPTFTLTSTTLPTPQKDQVLLKVLYLSNDPAQRGWISADIDPERLYAPPVKMAETLTLALTIMNIDLCIYHFLSFFFLQKVEENYDCS